VNLEEIKLILENHPLARDIDAISLSFIDFNNLSSQDFTFISNGQKLSLDDQKIFYDLASVTKPLTIGFIQFIASELLKETMFKLLLNHESGIPPWGLLSKNNWQEQISNYEINRSDVVYSDFGALRSQIEFEKITSKNLYDECSILWDKEIVHWSEVDPNMCLKTGERGFRPIVGDVHDPNAWVIKNKVSHAGLFGTITGVNNTLMELEKKFKICDYFLSQMKGQKKTRFINAWDSVEDKTHTLAGNHCGDYTVGHLGFTGTGFWIDCQKKVGVVILSNATRDGWYRKVNLNDVRKKIGNLLWTNK